MPSSELLLTGKQEKEQDWFAKLQESAKDLWQWGESAAFEISGNYDFFWIVAGELGVYKDPFRCSPTGATESTLERIFRVNDSGGVETSQELRRSSKSKNGGFTMVESVAMKLEEVTESDICHHMPTTRETAVSFSAAMEPLNLRQAFPITKFRPNSPAAILVAEYCPADSGWEFKSASYRYWDEYREQIQLAGGESISPLFHIMAKGVQRIAGKRSFSPFHQALVPPAISARAVHRKFFASPWIPAPN